MYVMNAVFPEKEKEREQTSKYGGLRHSPCCILGRQVCEFPREKLVGGGGTAVMIHVHWRAGVESRCCIHVYVRIPTPTDRQTNAQRSQRQHKRLSDIS